MKIEMYDPQGVILEELKDRRFRQCDVALTYAWIIHQELKTADWARINRAIRERWKGKTALTRVKTLAWKFHGETWSTPARPAEGANE